MCPSRATVLAYRPALDGVRGISIIGVMAFHSGLAPGGWLGVDAFFTLSGFLITTLLLDESHTTGGIELRRFYWRRFLRLVPALAILTAICTAHTVTIVPEANRSGVMLFLVAVIFYVGNWASIAGAPQGLLGHTWSLSIEEQFYVLWPPAMRLAQRRMAPSLILFGLLATAGASIAYRCMSAQHGPDPWLGRYLYLGTLTHADAILIGCALAFWSRIRSSASATALSRTAALFALLFMVLAFMTVPLDYYFSWWIPTTAIAIATSLVILDTASIGSWVRRLLEFAPCVWIGRRSYGVYLWHLPIFVALSPSVGSGLHLQGWRLLSAWMATFAIAAVSYRYIEAPLLRFKSRPPAVLVRGRLTAAGHGTGSSLARR